MTREIKVLKKWQGSKSVPSISLQGKYLQEHNFNIGDQLRVELFRDEIRIRRITPEMILKVIREKNPEVERLIAEFDCVVCE